MDELTPAQTVGPYLGLLLRDELATMYATGRPGAVTLSGHVLDGDGAPVSDAMLELFQADADGRYLEGEAGGLTGFARLGTDADGRYELDVLKPGPVGDQAPHIAVALFARGLLNRVVTRIYFPDEAQRNAQDPVLARVGVQRRGTLIAVPDGEGLRFDIRLQGRGETVFFAL